MQPFPTVGTVPDAACALGASTVAEELRAGLEIDARGKHVYARADPAVEARRVGRPMQKGVVIPFELVGAKLPGIQEIQGCATMPCRRQSADPTRDLGCTARAVQEQLVQRLHVLRV